jgi:hypothetical protein
MRFARKLRPALLFLLLAGVILPMIACRPNPAPPAVVEENQMPAGEPEIYTASLVHIMEDGERRESRETRVARSGNLRREEWSENGERMALISHFDSGKTFLLNLGRQLYTETDLARPGPEKTRPGSPGPAAKALEAEAAEAGRQAEALEFAEDHFAEQPVSLENLPLADVYIADQLCKVTQKRAAFADGRTEVTTLFRAENLFGLVLKSERESLAAGRRLKLSSEWRELKLSASADDFVIPAGFKRVASFAGESRKQSGGN